MFSRRTAWDLTPNRFSRLVAERRRDGGPLIDLSESNPTRCGFRHPGPECLEHLRDHRALAYAPAAFGRDDARDAIRAYYDDRGVAVDRHRIVLTASTSEAYSYLFRLLADDGDEVLVPRPSYPLFDYLARLDGLVSRPFRLEPSAGGWHIDLDSVRRGLGSGHARAVLAVSPNNPTGSWVSERELNELDTLASGHDTAVICDEVFADFPFRDDDPGAVVAAARPSRALTFSLSGLSKVCGLPQMKLGWILVGGPDELVEGALRRLDVIADTYLSVATPIQLALPRLLAERHGFQDECRARIRANLARLRHELSELPAIQLLAADAGWYACLRVPRTSGEEALISALLLEDGVLVHPGYFFDLTPGAHLVLSLIVPEERFADGLSAILRRFPAADAGG